MNMTGYVCFDITNRTMELMRKKLEEKPVEEGKSEMKVESENQLEEWEI